MQKKYNNHQKQPSILNRLTKNDYSIYIYSDNHFLDIKQSSSDSEHRIENS